MTVVYFGPLTCSIITTTRKFFTILASVILFANPISTMQWVGTVLVFLGKSGREPEASPWSLSGAGGRCAVRAELEKGPGQSQAPEGGALRRPAPSPGKGERGFQQIVWPLGVFLCPTPGKSLSPSDRWQIGAVRLIFRSSSCDGCVKNFSVHGGCFLSSQAWDSMPNLGRA